MTYTKTPQPCIHYDCLEHAYPGLNGRCKKHYVPWTGSTRKQRLPRDWPSRAKAVLARDKGVCYVCGGSGAEAVDHVRPGDDHSMSNLKAIHQDRPPFCHRTKSAREGAAASNLAQGRGNLEHVIARRVAASRDTPMPWEVTLDP